MDTNTHTHRKETHAHTRALACLTKGMVHTDVLSVYMCTCFLLCLRAMQMAFKLSDLGHTAESLDVHLRWVAALETEFFLQGDQEKAAGLPISPLFDRTKPGVTKSQVGFYEVVVSASHHHGRRNSLFACMR